MRFRWSLQFSLRALLVVMLLCGVILGFAARIHSRATRQKQILAAVASAGGRIRYDFECYSESRYYAPHRWLAPKIGPDLVGNVLVMNFGGVPADGWREPMKSVFELQTVEHFSACCQGIEAVDVESLGRIRSLKRIHLSHVGELPDLRPIATLPQLELCGVNSCSGIAVTTLRPLQQVPRLKILDLCGTDAQDEIVPLLAQFPALEEVHVEASEITAAGLIHFQKSKTLRILHLDAGQTNPELAQQLPRVQLDVR